MADSLWELYKEKGWDMKIYQSILHNISRISKCPCFTEYRCIHNILPTDEQLGGKFCSENCPASEIWREFKTELLIIKRKYIYGDIDPF